MQQPCNNNRGVEGPDTAAIIIQPFPAFPFQWLSLGVDARKMEVTRRLKEEKHPVDQPCPRGWECTPVNQFPQQRYEMRPLLPALRPRKVPVVVSGADPHVPHEQRKANHDRGDAECASELELLGPIVLGAFATGSLGGATAWAAVGGR